VDRDVRVEEGFELVEVGGVDAAEVGVLELLDRLDAPSLVSRGIPSSIPMAALVSDSLISARVPMLRSLRFVARF
jgi:hypothetical protein